jgi:hypothetical protein
MLNVPFGFGLVKGGEITVITLGKPGAEVRYGGR